MSSATRSYIVNNIKLPINASFKEAFSVAAKRLEKLHFSCRNANFHIFRRSIDARDKNNIVFVYSVVVSGEFPSCDEKKLQEHNITCVQEITDIVCDVGSEKITARPVIVGAGPCGLFAALLLAERGYRPIILERGSSIKNRKKSVACFSEKGILDTDSNIQFGAGGAGTFSDGKLVTRINDPLCHYILRRFVDFGAPEEILYIAKPHIGTDILSIVIERMIDYVISLGAEIHYNTKYIDSYSVSGINYARTENGNFPYGVLILAIGHSSRDTYKTLIESNYAIEPKSFSVGMRIEHLSKNIDRAMYGNFAGNTALGHAEYNLSYDTKNRGVYTFCMCPGGEVVAAASEIGGVVVNGMSRHKRDGVNSNSAVVCSVFKEDYGANAIKAIEFQRKIENAAFNSAGSDYSAPIITVGDFLSDKLQKYPTTVMPSYRDGKHVKLVSPQEYLPAFVCNSIKNALLNFDKKIEGFAADDAVLTGAETRTSAPIRILRQSDTRLATGNSSVYPCGEGAGYAGGITSAAIDGIKTAIAVIKRFKP